ncbi:MAG: type VI secretion system contractile sheath small subunit [Gemmatimonadaceae bacterium]
MTDNIQQSIVKSNPGRINLMVEVMTDGAMRKTELPNRQMALGDYAGRTTDTPIAEREPININKDNFDGVMRNLDVSTELLVRDRNAGGDNETKVKLKFERLQDFHPEQVAKQVPQIVRLVATRKLLADLRNRVISTAEFRKRLEQVVRDPEALKQLASELDQIMGGVGEQTRSIPRTTEPAR